MSVSTDPTCPTGSYNLGQNKWKTLAPPPPPPPPPKIKDGKMARFGFCATSSLIWGGGGGRRGGDGDLLVHFISSKIVDGVYVRGIH